jgi:hypothetical protein
VSQASINQPETLAVTESYEDEAPAAATPEPTPEDLGQDPVAEGEPSDDAPDSTDD